MKVLGTNHFFKFLPRVVSLLLTLAKQSTSHFVHRKEKPNVLEMTSVFTGEPRQSNGLEGKLSLYKNKVIYLKKKLQREL